MLFRKIPCIIRKDMPALGPAAQRLPHALCTADKERDSKLFLQYLDRLADRRLRDKKQFGGLGKTECGGNVIENLI